jgi:hypothetical protein
VEGKTINTASDDMKRRVRKAIPFMFVLLLIVPFELEFRLNTENLSMTATLFAWTWAYRLLDYQTGFYNPPFYWYFQQPLLYTFLHFIFLASLIVFQWGLVSRKDTRNVGIFSLLPGIIVMTVNLVLGIITSGSSAILAPIPLPFAPILGLLVLKKKDTSSEEDSWLTENPVS